MPDITTAHQQYQTALKKSEDAAKSARERSLEEYLRLAQIDLEGLEKRDEVPAQKPSSRTGWFLETGWKKFTSGSAVNTTQTGLEEKLFQVYSRIEELKKREGGPAHKPSSRGPLLYTGWKKVASGVG